MPELPEVQTVVTTLRPALAGRRLGAVALLRREILRSAPAEALGAVAGQTALAIDRRGKKILIRLESGATLCIHLGMTGRLTIEQADAPMLPHTHLVIDLTPAVGERPRQLRFRDPRRFGGVWLLAPGVAADANLGPEPLAIRPDQLHQLLARTRRPIKSALLDQSLLAGLGNIYVDESLFAAGIHPLTPANRLDAEQSARLARSIKRILRRAIRHRGSTLRDYVDANGQSGAFQNLHRVYDREGQPCCVCSAPIQRIVLSGRSTHFCPRCQPPLTGRREG